MSKIAICYLFSALLAFGATVPKAVQRSGAGVSAQGDAAIENAIKAKLAKSKIGADHFKVRVQGGIAYWEGSTDVIQHKGAATRMAKTAGAKAVVNNITIGQAAREQAKARLKSARKPAKVKRGDPRSEPRSESRNTVMAEPRSAPRSEPRAAVIRH